MLLGDELSPAEDASGKSFSDGERFEGQSKS